MKFKEFFNNLLSEMVERMAVPDGPIIVAHKGNVWRLDNDDDNPENLKIIADIAKNTGLDANYIHDIDDLMRYVEIELPDIFIGRIEDDLLINSILDTDVMGVNSPLVKKIVQMYKLRGIQEFDHDDQTHIYNTDDIIGDYPDVVYHGTNTKFMYGILKKDLNPSVKNGNWGFKFDDKVYVTSRLWYAAFHASHSALRNHSIPVILELNVPDKRLLTADFDAHRKYRGPDELADKEGYSNHYNRTYGSDHAKRHETIKQHSPKTDFTKASGVYGYKGRIPASQIRAIYIMNDYDSSTGKVEVNQLTKITDPKEFYKAIDMLDELGFYDPNWNGLDNEL